ncbi:MAG: cobalamin-dependent protein [Dehalococcoidia bacterium]|nr:cobalamin-dependent protein [Dehalococcoidia bacterium]
MSDDLITSLVDLESDDVIDMVKSRVGRGEDPVQILEECRQGMTTVGDRFQKGDYFLAELLLSAQIFKEAVAILQPYLARSRPAKSLGKVVLATPKGDIHDLGKNIVATLLQAHGFEVYDLGVDVPPSVVVEKIRETRPEFVGFSALITTAYDSMKEAAEMLVKAGLRDQLKLMVGGGVTTPMVKEYVGADFQTLDAMEGVAYCLKVIGGKQ